MSNTQLPDYILEAIEMKAEHEAALHFHPTYSLDQNTACRICYRNGAKEYATQVHQAERDLKKAKLLLKRVQKDFAGSVEMSERKSDRRLFTEIKTFLDGTK